MLLLMMLFRRLMAVWDSLLLDQRLCPRSMRVHYLVIGLSALPACLLTLKDLNLVLELTVGTPVKLHFIELLSDDFILLSNILLQVLNVDG